MENKDVDWDKFCKGFGTKIPSESIADKIEQVTPIKGFKVNKIMEKNKYYTPDIEEFHIGFQCQIFNGFSEWVDIAIEKSHFFNDLKFIEQFDNNSIKESFRVKYLGKEDIESLGWLYGGKSPEEYLGFNAKVDDTIYHLVIRETHVYINKAVPGERSDMGTSMRNSTLFNGRIKNKSELGRLMKQLDIQIN